MSRKLPNFMPNGIYHVYNRGIEKRNIFLDDADHFRFIHCLWEFNDVNPAPYNMSRYNIKERLDVRGLTSNNSNNKKKLVEVLAFCLMPNHFHLLLKETIEGGTSQFMRKIGTGYVMYFNKRRDRVGGLFQGSFKAVTVERDEQLMHLSRYIHLNPTKIIGTARNISEITKDDWLKVMKNLNQYRWSSYLDYIGKQNFPSVISEEVLKGYFKNQGDYKKFVEEYTILPHETILDVAID